MLVLYQHHIVVVLDERIGRNEQSFVDVQVNSSVDIQITVPEEIGAERPAEKLSERLQHPPLKMHVEEPRTRLVVEKMEGVALRRLAIRTDIVQEISIQVRVLIRHEEAPGNFSSRRRRRRRRRYPPSITDYHCRKDRRRRRRRKDNHTVIIMESRSRQYSFFSFILTKNINIVFFYIINFPLFFSNDISSLPVIIRVQYTINQTVSTNHFKYTPDLVR